MPFPRASNQRGRQKNKLKNATSTNTEEYPDSCLFCEVSDDDEEIFGRMVRKCGITVHYFCMLFSSGLSQRGKTEEDGIYGFLPSDIGKEKTRGARLKCTFCRKNGATIGCVVKNCRKVFHFGCGQKAGALNQYFDSYRSFCTSHRPRQTCPVSDRLSFYGTANSMCVICMSAVEARASNDTLRAPCCKNTWFHRKCIQRQALAAGLYFFKCPLCCNKEIFQAEMLQVGIYIPEQDAAWEMEPHAYQELLEPYNHCDMDACLCPRGRKYNRDDSKWEIVVCHWCGSQGSHIGCFSRKNTPTSSSGSRRVRWSCQSCALIDDELRKERRKKKASCSPVNQDSVDLPSGKSLTQSEHVGRKLPVKRSNTLQSSSVSTEQNDGESSTSSPSDLSGNQSASTLTPRIRRNRKQKRNLWKRGLLLRSTAKKRKVISATVTQAEATLTANESCLDEQSPSQQVNAENVNPATAETHRNTISSSLVSEAPCSSTKLTENRHKKGKKRSTSLGKHLSDSEILSDIKNNKLCDRSTTSQSAPRLRRQALASNSPYVLRDRKNSNTSRRALPYFRNRRNLRSNKTMKDFDFASSWKRTLQESSMKSTTAQKKQKLQDGNNNSDLHLSSDMNGTCFSLVNDSPPQQLNLLPPCSSSSPSSCSAVEVSRESRSASCASPAFSKCLTKNAIYFDRENSKSIEKMVDCDCISCSDFVIISSDNENEIEEEKNTSVFMSISLSEMDPDENSSLTLLSVSVSEGETGSISTIGHLQEQKCDDPDCDCDSANPWVYPTPLLSVSNNVQFTSTNSAYEIDSHYQLAAMKQFIESTPGSASSSPSSSSVITLSSSSDFECCKSDDDLDTNSCPIQMQAT